VIKVQGQRGIVKYSYQEAGMDWTTIFTSMDWATIFTAAITAAISSAIAASATLIATVITAGWQVSKALPSWKRLYENDEHGNKISGDITKLIEAVGNGYPIRVKIIKGKDDFEIFNAEWAFAQDGNVIAQNSSQFSMGRDGRFLKSPYHFAVSAITDGRYHASRFTFTGDKVREPSDWNKRMIWFGMMPEK
jgi:hypothetical protein